MPGRTRRVGELRAEGPGSALTQPPCPAVQRSRQRPAVPHWRVSHSRSPSAAARAVPPGREALSLRGASGPGSARRRPPLGSSSGRDPPRCPFSSRGTAPGRAAVTATGRPAPPAPRPSAPRPSAAPPTAPLPPRRLRGVSRGQRPPPAAGSAAAAPASPARRSPVAGETARVLSLAAAADGPGESRGGGVGRGPRSSASGRRRGLGRGDRGAARGRGVILLLSVCVLLCGLPEASGPPSASQMDVCGQRTARGRARGFCRVHPGAVRERSGPLSLPWRLWGCCLTARGSGRRVAVRCQAASRCTWGHKL